MKETVQLSQLKRLIARESGEELSVVSVFVDTMIRLVVEAIIDDERVEINGFGSFAVVKDDKEKKNRLIFTPDARMRISVNSPFALFESVVLGIDDAQIIEKDSFVLEGPIDDEEDVVSEISEKESVRGKSCSDEDKALGKSPRPLNIELPEVKIAKIKKFGQESESDDSINNIFQSEDDESSSEELKQKDLMENNSEEKKKIDLSQSDATESDAQGDSLDVINQRNGNEEEDMESVFEQTDEDEIPLQDTEQEPESENDEPAEAAPVEPEVRKTAQQASLQERLSASLDSVKGAIGGCRYFSKEWMRENAIVMGAIAVGILLFALLITFIFGGSSKPKQKAVQNVAATAPTAQAEPENAVVAESEELKVEEPEAEPAKPEKAAPAAKKSNIARHTIKSGERLTLVALQYYNHKEMWVYIYEANKTKLPDPNKIEPGTQLDIPSLSNFGIQKVTDAELKKAKAMEKKICGK